MDTIWTPNSRWRFQTKMDDLTSHLKEQSTKAVTTETFIGNRRVKTIRKPITEEKEKTARESILKALFGFIKWSKNKKQKK